MSVSNAARTPAATGPDIRARESAASRSRSATRQRLLASGIALFARNGLHGVTTHDIAREASVAVGTFYLHFKDKRELFREIAALTLAELRDRLGAAAASADHLRDGVPRIAEALVGYAEENRDRVRIVFSIDRDTVDVASDLLSELAAMISEGRAQRIHAGEMPGDLDPVILSQALVGMWARVIAWWVEDPSRAPRTTLIKTLTQIQLSGTHPA